MYNYSGNGEVFCHVENDKTVVDGADIRVDEYSCDMDTGHFTITATFRDGNVNITDTVGYDSNLTKSLENRGYFITSKLHEHHLKSYIQKQIESLEAVHKHSMLGWVKSGEHLFFYAYCSIGAETKSSYGGNLDIEPHNDEKYRKKFNTLISGNTPLEFACVMGVSGCLVGYLNAVGAERIETMLYDIFGNTSTGKTTSIKLAVSMCGKPFTSNGKESLFGSCLTTKNAITARLNDNNGFFIAFDELEMIGKSDMTDMVYSIPNGIDKSRCDVTGDIRAARCWNTAVAFTGEHSVFESTTQKDGLQFRTISLGNISWMKDGQQAREVEKFANSNYGIILIAVAKYLQSQTPENVLQEYDAEVARIENRMAFDDSLRNRKAKKVAVIALTAKYNKAAISVNLDESAIEQFVLNNAFKLLEREYIRAYEYVLGKFHENAKYFFYFTITLKATVSHNLSAENYVGSYDENQITVLASTLEQWLVKGGYTNPKSILSKWKESGRLNAPHDRLYKKLSICVGRKPEKVYVIRRITDTVDDDSWKDQFEREYWLYYSKCRNRELKKMAERFKEAFDMGELPEELLSDMIDDAKNSAYNFEEYSKRWKYFKNPELKGIEAERKAKEIEELLATLKDD